MEPRKYYGAAQWKEWILECKESGMHIKEWCALHNLEESVFYRWRRKLVSRGEIEWVCSKEPIIQSVVQVNLLDSNGTRSSYSQGNTLEASLVESILASKVVIEVPSSGCRVYVGTDFSGDTLKRVMEVLQ